MVSTWGRDTAYSALGSNKSLILASNRAPIEHKLDASGRLRRASASGGLATALGSSSRVPFTWIASTATPEDQIMSLALGSIHLNEAQRLRYVTPPADAYDLHYEAFCNPILWFIQHGLSDRLLPHRTPEHIEAAWRYGYVPVNQAFACAIVDELRGRTESTGVMLHDYHLYLTPRFLRNLGAAAVLQHFVHIPWPEPQGWDRLPRAILESICSGLLANDSVVFQTEAFAHNFVATCREVLPDSQASIRGDEIMYQGRRTLVSANPISVDLTALRDQVTSPEARSYISRLAPKRDELTIVRVDRMDPSKNILAGFEAFDALLRRHPEWIGRVRFLAFLVPSRTSVPEYRGYSHDVVAKIRSINARYARDGWKPIRLFHEHNRVQALAGLTHYDVLLANSLADGMNLVAKEGPVVNQRDGVLVLSTAAGSFEQLKDGVLPIAPTDIGATAEAMHRALLLPQRERRYRAMQLRHAVLRSDLSRWLERQIDDIEAVDRSIVDLAPPRPGRRLSIVPR